MRPYTLTQALTAVKQGTISSSELLSACATRQRETSALNAFVESMVVPIITPSATSDTRESPQKVSSSSSPSSPSPSSFPLSSVTQRTENKLNSSNVHQHQHLLLQGLPISVKANICIEGIRTTAGSRMLTSYTSPITATVVSRLLSAGATVVGTTKMDEFGMGSDTSTCYPGPPTYNPFSVPWALSVLLRGGGAAGAAFEKTDSTTHISPLPTTTSDNVNNIHDEEWLVPGGSSGGAAVSVATGSALAAIGSDTGGSVRQPAAFVGVVGFKPTYGRIPRWGLIPYASSLDTIGLFARSVDDIALLYSLTAGYDSRDDTSIREKRIMEIKVVENTAKPLSGMRVGIPIEYNVAEIDEATTTYWWDEGARMLAEQGATIVPVSLPSTRVALPAYYLLAPAEAASNLARYDGVRYGHRATTTTTQNNDDTATTAANISNNGATLLQELYARTRSEGFGTEVQRRIMLGNFVLSAGARKDYYDAAISARDAVRADFAKVFRPSPTTHQVEVSETIRASPIARANIAAHVVGDPTTGVDVLLTPVAPTPPWKHTSRKDPLSMYVNDVMTIPASLAHLPAISVPVGSVPYPYKIHAPSAQGILKQLSLPVGLQIIGRHCDDATVLQVAAALERGGNYRLPSYVTGGM